MDDFDRFLELELGRLLDPVVSAAPPRRGSAGRSRRRILTVKPVRIGSAADMITGAEPAVVTVPVITQR